MDAAADTPAKSERDPRAAVREARAEQYLKRDLEDQRRWYGERASRFKVRAQALGAVVALAEGWRQIARYDEAWAAYRLASERMKRERRLFVNGAGEYRGLADEEEAFLRFVEAVEAIVAEEQRIYWQKRGDRAGNGAPSSRVPSLPSAAGHCKAVGAEAERRAHGRL